MPKGDPGNPCGSAENGEALPALERGDDADNAGGDCDEMTDDDDDVTIEMAASRDVFSRSSETGFACSGELNGNGSFGRPSFRICARLVPLLEAGATPSLPS